MTHENKLTLASAMDHSTIGAHRELIAAAHFLALGFDVARALSPSCGYDLVVGTGAVLCRVQVRAARRNENTQSLQFGYHKQEHDKFDVLALVLASAEVRVFPSMEEWVAGRRVTPEEILRLRYKLKPRLPRVK